MRDLKSRGLNGGPKLAIGDGALGFWAALSEEVPETKTQRCWVHKTANILDKLPKGLQAKAKEDIHDIYLSDTRKNALKSYDIFVKTYEAKYPKSIQCLTKDKDNLFSFYDFPAQHWHHIRTTNVVESVFATVRLRTKRTKGCGNRTTTLTMVFQLLREAQKKWARLRGSKFVPHVIDGQQFMDGILAEERMMA